MYFRNALLISLLSFFSCTLSAQELCTIPLEAPSNSTGVFLDSPSLDENGDGVPEFLDLTFQVSGTAYSLDIVDIANGEILRTLTGVLAEFQTFSDSFTVIPVFDLDGDGVNDYRAFVFETSSGVFRRYYLDISGADGRAIEFTQIREIVGGSEGVLDLDIGSLLNRDLDGDGIRDFGRKADGREQIISGNDSSVLFEISSASDLQGMLSQIQIEESFDSLYEVVPDMNGDGANELAAMICVGASVGQGKDCELLLWSGVNLTASPLALLVFESLIASPALYSLSDITGDGLGEIAVVFGDQFQQDTQLRVFTLSNSSLEEVFERTLERQRVNAIDSRLDLNGDGVADLLLSNASFELNSTASALQVLSGTDGTDLGSFELPGTAIQDAVAVVKNGSLGILYHPANDPFRAEGLFSLMNCPGFKGGAPDVLAQEPDVEEPEFVAEVIEVAEEAIETILVSIPAAQKKVGKKPSKKSKRKKWRKRRKAQKEAREQIAAAIGSLVSIQDSAVSVEGFGEVSAISVQRLSRLYIRARRAKARKRRRAWKALRAALNG